MDAAADFLEALADRHDCTSASTERILAATIPTHSGSRFSIQSDMAVYWVARFVCPY
jgi:hypothetical protein